MSGNIYGVQFYCEDDGWYVVLDGDFGTRTIGCEPGDFDEALRPWRDQAEGGVTRIVSDNKNWLKAMARNNPEFVEVYAVEDFS